MAGLQSIPLVHDPWHCFGPGQLLLFQAYLCACAPGAMWRRHVVGKGQSLADVSCATHSCENSPGPILSPCTEIALIVGRHLVFVWFAGVYQTTNTVCMGKGEVLSLCFSHRLFLSVWRPKWTSVHLLSNTQLWQQVWWLQPWSQNIGKKDETRERKRMNEWSVKNLTAGEDGSYYSPAMHTSPMCRFTHRIGEPWMVNCSNLFYTKNTRKKYQTDWLSWDGYS